MKSITSACFAFSSFDDSVFNMGATTTLSKHESGEGDRVKLFAYKIKLKIFKIATEYSGQNKDLFEKRC
jgi:hypothetical protein